MEHVAIDLGGRESQICIRDGSGGIISEARIATASLGETLDRPKSRVVMETCAEAFAVADLALGYGHEVRVVPASLVRSLGVGARKTKTDRRDAQVLSEVSCRVDLPSVHVPSHWSREAKSLCGMRDVLVGARTRLVSSVRGYLRQKLKRFQGGTAATLLARVRKRYEEIGRAMPGHLERQLQAIEYLHAAAKAATLEVNELAERNPVCVRLMTVPGVGAITAVRFVAAIDQVKRFSNAHQLESYLGLTPGEDSSSDRRRVISITKAVPSAVRWVLVQAAWAAMREPMCKWALQVARRRGGLIATIALARKLGGILYAMWRDGTTYDVPAAPRRRAGGDAGNVAEGAQNGHRARHRQRCPETVTALLGQETRGALPCGDLVAPNAARRRTSARAAWTANSRMRQLVDAAAVHRASASPYEWRWTGLLLHGQSLHSRPRVIHDAR